MKKLLLIALLVVGCEDKCEDLDDSQSGRCLVVYANHNYPEIEDLYDVYCYSNNTECDCHNNPDNRLIEEYDLTLGRWLSIEDLEVTCEEFCDSPISWEEEHPPSSIFINPLNGHIPATINSCTVK